jgi:hypothetical protein
MFVVAQVRQALQQTVAIGAFSPYLAVARVTRSVQTVFTRRAYSRRRRAEAASYGVGCHAGGASPAGTAFSVVRRVCAPPETGHRAIPPR